MMVRIIARAFAPVVLFSLLSTAPLLAAPMYWDTSPGSPLQAGDGQWDLNTTASWSDNIDGSSPLLNWTSSADDAIFQASGTSLVTVFGTNVGANSIVFNGTGYTIGSQRVAVGAGGIVANESATMQGVTLGASQSVTVADGKTLTLGNMISYGNGIEWIKDGDGTLSTAHLYVGNTAGTTGTFTVEEGTLDVNGHLILGAIVDNSTGILNVSGGEINISSVMYLGHIGNGTVNQTGGSVNLGHSQGMRVCTDRTDTTGIYNLDGGILRTRDIGTNPKDPDNRTMLLSFGGGTLEYTGTGLMTPATQFEFKAGGGTISIPNSNATMHVKQEITGTGDGLLTVTGPGTLIVEEGAFGGVELLGGELVKDGAGTLTVTDAALGTIAMRVGSGAAYTHKDGTLNITSISHAFRIAGDTTMTQEGGTINATGFLILGRGETGDTPGTATYDMTGGTLNVSRQIYIGYNTKAVFNQSGGNVVATGMRLADFTGGLDSEYNLSGGSLTVNGLTSVGFRNNVEFHQTGGTASFRDLVIGGGGGASSVGDTATYTLTDGDMTIGTGFSLSVGLDRGYEGRLNVDGGTITANGNVFVGNVTANAGSATGIVTQTDGQVTIAPDRALSFRATGDYTATYNLNGGTLTLAAIQYTDTSTQQFNFGGGTLQANGNLNTDMPMTVNAGGATIDTQAHSVTLDGALSGDGGLTKLGDGTLLLTGVNSYEGGTTVSAGTLRGDTTSLQGDILNDATLVFDQATDGVYAGTLSGSGTLTKTGPGVLTLMEGTIRSLALAQGELVKDGAGTLVISSGNLAVGTDRTYTHKDGHLDVNANYPIHISGSGVINQKGGTIDAETHVAVLGEGTGTAVYNMEGGKLEFRELFAGWKGRGIVNHSDGTVTISRDLRVASDAGTPGSTGSEYNLSGTGFLAVTRNTHVAYRSDGEFNQTGGEASFSNLYIGGGGPGPDGDTAIYNLTNGQLNVSTSLWVGRDYGFTGNLNVEDGTIVVDGDMNIGNVTDNGGATGIVTQTGGQVTIAPDRALSFRATGTHTAAYHLNGGTLTLAALNYTDASTQQFNFGGGTLQANGTLNTDMPMTINTGGATVDTQGHTVTLGGALSGDGGLTKLGDGTLLLTGPNIYGGGTTVSAGTLRGDTTSLQGDILNDATLVFDQATDGVYAGTLSGSGTLTKTGPGALTLMEGTIGSLDFDQGELIKDGPGTLMISSDGLRVRAGRTYTHKAGTLNNASFIHSMRVAGTATVAQEGGTINSTGHIVLGEGTGTATYEMTGGELNVTSGVYAGWSRHGVFDHSGGTVTTPSLRVADSVGSHDSEYNLSGAGSLTVTGTATVAYRDDAQFNQTGGTALFRYLNIGGGGANPKVGTGDYTLSGGEVTIRNDGWLSVGHDYGYTANLNVHQGGTILTNGDVFIGNVTGNNDGATGTITQTGGQVTIAPDRALSFRAAGTHTAAYHLNGGTLTLADIQYTDTSTQQFNFGGGTLQANGNLNTDMPMTIHAGGATVDTQGHTVTLGGELSGDGGLAKLGDGTLTVTGENTFEGGTTVSAGTLMVANTSGSGTGSGPVSVNPAAPGTDAILGGTGAVAGTVTIHSGGMHAPGASVGEQTIGGAVWHSGGMFQFEINDTLGFAGGDPDGLGWDLVTIDDGAGTGKLDLRDLNKDEQFAIHIVSLDGTSPGEIANFNPTVPYDWVFVTYDELVDDYFHPNLFAINASGFENAIGAGRFAVTQVPGGLAVSFIPEPGTLLMALAALVLLVCRRRRE